MAHGRKPTVYAKIRLTRGAWVRRIRDGEAYRQQKTAVYEAWCATELGYPCPWNFTNEEGEFVYVDHRYRVEVVATWKPPDGQRHKPVGNSLKATHAYVYPFDRQAAKREIVRLFFEEKATKYGTARRLGLDYKYVKSVIKAEEKRRREEAEKKEARGE